MTYTIWTPGKRSGHKVPITDYACPHGPHRDDQSEYTNLNMRPQFPSVTLVCIFGAFPSWEREIYPTYIDIQPTNQPTSVVL